MKTMRNRWAKLFLAAVACALSAGAQDLSLPKVVVALKPDKNPELMLQEKTVFESYLAGALGSEAEVVIPLSASTILEGLANGTIDLGYLSATDMVNARKRGMATLLLAGEFPDGRAAYDSYWVTLKDAPYRSVEDLKGKPVAFASRTSTSGFIIPLLDLRQRGLVGEDANLESFFGRGNVAFGVGYVSAVERVLSGEAEAAAVSYYVLDLDKHLTVEQRGLLRMLQSQGPVPSHVIAARSSLSSEDKEILKSALLGLNDPARHDLRDKLFTTKLIEVDEDEHLDDLADGVDLALRALRP